MHANAQPTCAQVAGNIACDNGPGKQPETALCVQHSVWQLPFKPSANVLHRSSIHHSKTQSAKTAQHLRRCRHPSSGGGGPTVAGAPFDAIPTSTSEGGRLSESPFPAAHLQAGALAGAGRVLQGQGWGRPAAGALPARAVLDVLQIVCCETPYAPVSA